jgi:hypothetical protein
MHTAREHAQHTRRKKVSFMPNSTTKVQSCSRGSGCTLASAAHNRRTYIHALLDRAKHPSITFSYLLKMLSVLAGDTCCTQLGDGAKTKLSESCLSSAALKARNGQACTHATSRVVVRLAAGVAPAHEQLTGGISSRARFSLKVPRRCTINLKPPSSSLHRVTTA